MATQPLSTPPAPVTTGDVSLDVSQGARQALDSIYGEHGVLPETDDSTEDQDNRVDDADGGDGFDDATEADDLEADTTDTTEDADDDDDNADNKAGKPAAKVDTDTTEGKRAKAASIAKIGQRIAKQRGWDPDNLTDDQEDILSQLANQEWTIQQLKAGKGTTMADAVDDDLDKMLEQLLQSAQGDESTATDDNRNKKADEKPPATDASAKPAASADPDAPTFSFKDSKDYIKKVNVAAQAGDADEIARLQEEYFQFNIYRIAPAIEQTVAALVEQGIQQRLAPHLPVVQRMSERENRNTAVETAVQQIETFKANPADPKSPSPFADIRGIFKPDGQPPIVINGKEMPSSPFLRIIRANPELRHILVLGKDGKRDEVATQRGLLTAVYRRWKANKPSAKAVQQVAEASLKAGERRAKRDDAATMGKSSKAGVARSTKPATGEDDYVSQLFAEAKRARGY